MATDRTAQTEPGAEGTTVYALKSNARNRFPGTSWTENAVSCIGFRPAGSEAWVPERCRARHPDDAAQRRPRRDSLPPHLSAPPSKHGSTTAAKNGSTATKNGSTVTAAKNGCTASKNGGRPWRAWFQPWLKGFWKARRRAVRLVQRGITCAYASWSR
eukprot:2643000-Rhodomonas_salina.1